MHKVLKKNFLPNNGILVGISCKKEEKVGEAANEVRPELFTIKKLEMSDDIYAP